MFPLIIFGVIAPKPLNGASPQLYRTHDIGAPAPNINPNRDFSASE
jgi:hypothetical protein